MTLIKFNQPVSKNINGWMEDILNDFSIPYTNSFDVDSAKPRVNIKKTSDGYNLEVFAPGRSKEDFKINIDKRLLVISYDKENGQKIEGETFIKREFTAQPFKRSFTLDDKVDSDNILAKYENGVLNLHLPKRIEAKVSTKEIAVQ